MPVWSPDGSAITYVTWTTTGGHIKRVAAAGGAPTTLTTHEGYYLDPAYTPDGRAARVHRRHRHRSRLLDPPDTPPPDDEDGAPGEITGVDAPNTLEIRRMPAAGGASTLVASAQGGRAPQFIRNDSRACT